MALTCEEIEWGEDEPEPLAPPGKLVPSDPSLQPRTGESYEMLLASGRIADLEPPPTWLEYLHAFPVQWQPHLEAARAWLLARSAGVPTANEWVNSHYLRFSDGSLQFFGSRSWAQFAAAATDCQEHYVLYLHRENQS